MEVIKIKTESIAHLSYLVIDQGQAAVIDPRRDCEIYLEMAQEREAQINYIFETHRNEDLVTGSRELERYTQAEIIHGKNLDFEFGTPHLDGSEFKLGEGNLKLLETPGHTPESISVALFAHHEDRYPTGVFTGDTLFVGDVGRTDFFKGQEEEYASMLYSSLHDRLLPLGDQTIIYPAHGSGSVCGGNISNREFSTLGHEKLYNPMLKLSKQEFITVKANEKHQIPPYFKRMEEINIKGNDIPLNNYEKLDLIDEENLRSQSVTSQIIDTRSAEAFIGLSTPVGLSIPKEMIGAYAGYFLEYDQDIYLISQNVQEAKEVRKELLRLGYDKVKGTLMNGIKSIQQSYNWQKQSLAICPIDKIKDRQEQGALLLDIRKPSEWDGGIIKGARTIFLGDLPQQINELNKKPENYNLL